MKCLMFMLNPKEDDIYIAYLPLAHVLELMSENTMMLFGIKVTPNIYGEIGWFIDIKEYRLLNGTYCLPCLLH